MSSHCFFQSQTELFFFQLFVVHMSSQFVVASLCSEEVVGVIQSFLGIDRDMLPILSSCAACHARRLWRFLVSRRINGQRLTIGEFCADSAAILNDDIVIIPGDHSPVVLLPPTPQSFFFPATPEIDEFSPPQSFFFPVTPADGEYSPHIPDVSVEFSPHTPEGLHSPDSSPNGAVRE